MTQPGFTFAPEPNTEPTSLAEKLAAYFKARPNQWIDGRRLEDIAGRYAWRTRVSDCRRQLGMTIENRQRRVRRVLNLDGEDCDLGSYTVSEYRYVPNDAVKAA